MGVDTLLAKKQTIDTKNSTRHARRLRIRPEVKVRDIRWEIRAGSIRQLPTGNSNRQQVYYRLEHEMLELFMQQVNQSCWKWSYGKMPMWRVEELRTGSA